jgi:hypothetical protein
MMHPLKTKHSSILMFLITLGFLVFIFSYSSRGQTSKIATPGQTPASSTPKKSRQRPDPKQCPSCPEPSQQKIYAPTIGLTEALDSQIVLNNRSPNVMDVTPTFYTEDGSTIVGEAVQLQPTEIRFVDIKKLIPAQHRGQHTWGGMSLSYTGNVLEVWAQITLTGVGGTASTDVTFSVLDGRGSDVQEAVWWMPERGTAVIALGNSSETALRTIVQFSGGESQDVDIAPFATKYIRRRTQDRSSPNSLSEGAAEAVKLTTVGPSGSLRVVGVVTSDNQKFTSSIRFYDPQGAVQPHLFATNLRLKNTLPRMVLKNTSDTEVSAQPRFRPATGEGSGVVELPALMLKPQEVVEVDLRSLMSNIADRTDLDSVSVQVTNSGRPGSLIGALNSVGTITHTFYDVPLRDSGRTRNLTGSYPWRVDKDYTTIVTITNVGDQPAKFHVDVRYPGGSYYLAPQELAIGETATFNLREMQAAQKPDNKGNKFLKSVSSGQFHWSVAPTPGNPKLVGRAEVVSTSEKVSSSYSCPVCCPDSGPYGDWTDGGPLYVDGFEAIGSSGQYYDCYWYVTYTGSFPMSAQWVATSSIATNESGPGYDTTVHGLSAGSTSLMGEWDYQYNFSDGMDCYYQFDHSGGDTPVAVNDVKIMFNGADVTNQTRDVIVGQQISLSLQVLPSTSSATNIQWTVPGNRIANYVATSANGSVTPLSNLQSAQLSFYWVDGANGRQVTVTGKVAGVTFNKTTTFNVKRPTASVTTTTDDVYANQLSIKITFGHDFVPGISFVQTVTYPQGFTGTTQWVQIATPLRRRKTNAGVWQRWSGAGLDTIYPYWGSGNTNDSPSTFLDASHNDGYIIVEKSMNDSFDMYLMFKPSGTNSIWVPLRKVSWFWSATGTYNQTTITLVSKNHSVNPASTDSVTHPQWTRNAANNQWINE